MSQVSTSHTANDGGVINIVSERATLPMRSPAERKVLKQHIPELLWFERLLRKYDGDFDLRVEHLLRCDEHALPLYSLCLGNRVDPSAPTLLLTGGVHGVERIGTQVLLAWLQSLLERLKWDGDLQNKLAQLQLVCVPMVNPIGVYKNFRCNGNGVDLNRNAPIDAVDKVPFLAGGQRLSQHLPWYRGRPGADMEAENKALQRVVERHVYTRPFALSLDVHSGFGTKDRLWIPYAFRRKAIGNIDEYLALKLLWERCYPNHDYQFEPQSLHYLSHGDMWDYFYRQSKGKTCAHYMPLTLELGSWAWVKKSPRQLFNFAGLFNPQKRHRHSRVLRRHLLLLDFLLSAALHHAQWLPDKHQSPLLKQAALGMWYK